MNRTSAPRVIVIDKTIFRTVIVKIQYASTDVSSPQPAWVTTALQTSVMHVCHGWQHIQAKIYLCLPGLVPCYMRGECGNSWHLPYAGASWWENFALHRQYFFEWATKLPWISFCNSASRSATPAGRSHSQAQTVMVQWPLSAACVM